MELAVAEAEVVAPHRALQARLPLPAPPAHPAPPVLLAPPARQRRRALS